MSRRLRSRKRPRSTDAEDSSKRPRSTDAQDSSRRYLTRQSVRQQQAENSEVPVRRIRNAASLFLCSFVVCRARQAEHSSNVEDSGNVVHNRQASVVEDSGNVVNNVRVGRYRMRQSAEQRCQEQAVNTASHQAKRRTKRWRPRRGIALQPPDNAFDAVHDAGWFGPPPDDMDVDSDLHGVICRHCGACLLKAEVPANRKAESDICCSFGKVKLPPTERGSKAFEDAFLADTRAARVARKHARRLNSLLSLAIPIANEVCRGNSHVCSR